MLTQEELERLIELRRETRAVDFKRGFKWSAENLDTMLGIIKDLLAMANSQDGGVIILGVADSKSSSIGLSDEEVDSIDVTKVNELFHRYADPKHHCLVSKHNVSSATIVTIEVPECSVEPIICKADAFSQADSKKRILERGAVYHRTEKASTEKIASSEDMRALLGRSLRKTGDELLSRIEQLFSGRTSALPAAAEDGFAVEQNQASEWFHSDQYLGPHWKDHGHWMINAYPVDYTKDRIPSHRELKSLIKDATVSLRGWEFPWTDNSSNSKNIANGVQSWIVSDRYVEGYRAYTSGLFVWKQALYEDVVGMRREGSRILDPTMLILSLTEMFLFFKRFFGGVAGVQRVRYSILLNGTQHRLLHPVSEKVRTPYVDSVCAERFVSVEGAVTEARLSTDYLELAGNSAKRIFAVFQQDNVTDQTIREWQDRLLRRNFP